MPNQTRVTELDELERQLASLEPKVAGVDRDQLIFLAGQHSARTQRRYHWVWPTATGFWALTAVSLAMALAFRGGDERVLSRPAADRTQRPFEESSARGSDSLSAADGTLQLALDVPSTPAYFRLRRMTVMSDWDAFTDPPGQQIALGTASPPYRLIERGNFQFQEQ